MEKRPHILFIPSFCDDKDRPLCGVFFVEQAMELSRACRVGMVYSEMRGLQQFSLAELRRSHFQSTTYSRGGVTFYRQHGWNPLVQTAIGGYVWTALVRRLVDRYIAAYGKPDLIHAQCAIWGGEAARRSAAKYGVPYVVTEHNSMVRNSRAVERYMKPMLRAYTGAAWVSAVGSHLASAISAMGLDRAIEITPNLLDRTFCRPCRRTPREKEFRYLAVAGHNREKRLDVLLDAFHRVKMKQPDSMLRIIGRGPEGSALAAMAARLDLTKSVHFLGERSRAEVRQWMLDSDLLVISSAVETFSIVAIEALSTGLPVVATRCGGPEDILEQGRFGQLVPPADPESLALAMLDAQRAPGRQEELRRYAIGKYGPDAFVERMAKLYGRVCAV